MAKYTAIEIAEYIVTYGWLNKKPVNNIRLFPALFVVQMEYMKKTGDLLFDEPFIFSSSSSRLGKIEIPILNDYTKENCCFHPGSFLKTPKWIDSNTRNIINSILDSCLVENTLAILQDIYNLHCVKTLSEGEEINYLVLYYELKGNLNGIKKINFNSF